MPLGTDKQYDISWEEQDKIRRRLEIKDRLKQDGIRLRFDPFIQLKKQVYSDPAVERYMDMRKVGRLPNTPLKPSIFFSILASLTLPVVAIYYVMKWERADYLRLCSTGDYPVEKIPFKSRR